MFLGILWPFNAIHHCRAPDDVVQTLSWIRDHLGPNGRVAVDGPRDAVLKELQRPKSATVSAS